MHQIDKLITENFTSYQSVSYGNIVKRHESRQKLRNNEKMFYRRRSALCKNNFDGAFLCSAEQWLGTFGFKLIGICGYKIGHVTE